MIRKTLLVTCMAVFLGSCSEGTDSNGLSGFDGFELPSKEPTAGAALPVSSGVVSSVEASFLQPSPIIQAVENEQTETVSGIPTLGPSTPVEVNPYVESIATSSEELVSVPDSDSSKITTRSDFLFDTARTVQLRVNMLDIAGALGSLSICTDFQETSSGFDINYQSCPIRGTVANGQFEQDMSLMNQFDSVVAVIWFRNQEFAPRYQKFDTADLTESTEGQEWLWN